MRIGCGVRDGQHLGGIFNQAIVARSIKAVRAIAIKGQASWRSPVEGVCQGGSFTSIGIGRTHVAADGGIFINSHTRRACNWRIVGTGDGDY